jgi:hypothetical protein
MMIDKSILIALRARFQEQKGTRKKIITEVFGARP